MDAAHHDADLDVRLTRLEERITAMQRAVELQAAEYERRLGELNHEADRIQTVLSESVTAEKFEDYTKSEGEARDLALDRVEDKLAAVKEGFEERLGSQGDRIGSLDARISNVEGGTQVRAAHIGWWLAGLGLIITVVVVIVNTAIAS